MTDKLTRKEIADGLRKYNLWRRDNSVPSIYEMPNPKELGVWIDGAIEELGGDER